MPKESIFLLTNSRGTPWTKDGFRASWQAEMNRRPFRVLRKRRKVFHGLRKSAVVFLLEAGCTDAEVSAITGQSRQMVEHYAKAVNSAAPRTLCNPEVGERVRTNVDRSL